MTHVHLLKGCQPEPLSSYLKALGVLRLVSEQADPNARGHWCGEGFVLTTGLTEQGLLAFFTNDYRPTPVISPWNGGSGFYPKDNREGMAAIEGSAGERFALYRRVIAQGQRIADQHEAAGASKEDLLRICRSLLPDEAIDWLDSAVVILDQGPVYPPLLGTGGNDGRLDFSNNFMQRLAILFLGGKQPKGFDIGASIRASLFGGRVVGLRKAAIGQFAPGAAGGANSSPTGKAESLVNPLDFVLLLEGAALFAAGAARRLSSAGKGRASIPFTFDATAVGYGTAADEDGRGEIWAPLWGAPCSERELRRLFSEARMEWRGRQAKTALDAARATATLGADRGLEGFVRYSLLTRNGLATTAVPVGRIRTDPRAGIGILASLDPWLDRVRRTKPSERPATVESHLSRVDRAMYAAAGDGSGLALVAVLVAIAGLEGAIANAASFREGSGVRPLALPSDVARQWALVLAGVAVDDPELRLAISLGSLRDANSASAHGTTMRSILTRVVSSSSGGLEWSDRPRVAGFGSRELAELLADAHSFRYQLPGQAGGAFRYGQPTAWGDIALMSRGKVETQRLGSLLAGVMLINWSNVDPLTITVDEGAEDPAPAALTILAPFFRWSASVPPASSTEPSDEDGTTSQRASGRWTGLPAKLASTVWLNELAKGNPSNAITEAIAALRAEGANVVVRGSSYMAADVLSGANLSAGLLCRIPTNEICLRLRRICPDRGSL